MRFTKQALDERRNRILHIAYQLFCNHGIDQVTLTQIAKEANVGVSSIYRYFKTKANLLWHTQGMLWQEIVEQIYEEEREQLLSAKSGYEELSILLYHFKWLYTKRGSYLIFSIEYKVYLVRNRIEIPKQVYDWFLEPVHQLFLAALQRGHEDGSIRCEEDAEDQFFAIWGIMRTYTEQIVVFDKMYGGTNPWTSRFDLVHQYIMLGLKK